MNADGVLHVNFYSPKPVRRPEITDANGGIYRVLGGEPAKHIRRRWWVFELVSERINQPKLSL